MKGVFSRGLWMNTDFMRLWTGQSISMVGSQMTLLALPLTAVLVLHASPGQMGALAALEYAPFLLFGLVAGAYVDRLAARRVMIVADVVRCLLLAVVPLSAATHTLSIGELFGVAFGVGIGTAFFDVAYLAFVPRVVGSDELLSANARLEASRSVAGVIGPGLAGALVQLVSAPVVLLIDAASFIASAGLLTGMRSERDTAADGMPHGGLLREIVAGVTGVVRDPVLRALGGCVGTFNLFSSIVLAIYVLYVIRTLGVSAALLGVITAVGGIGALVGTTLAASTGGRGRAGQTIVGAVVLSAAGTLAIALVRGPLVVVTPTLATAQLAVELGVTACVVIVVSLRQSMTPAGREGRISATMRFLIYGTVPVGAVLGGVLGQVVGLRATVLVAAVGELLAPLWIVFSPVWSTAKASR